MAADPVLKVTELFYSIQGESSFAGYPCVFVRLAGCNLRCRYCDARYTYEEPGEEYALSRLLGYTAGYPGLPVEITGGEPLLQENVYALMAGLLAAGHTVLLETNGSLPLDRVPAGVIRIIDLKCPDSGMHDRMELRNLEMLAADDEVKFVLSSRTDYEWARATIRAHRLPERCRVLLSPVREWLPPSRLAEWMLTDRLAARLQLQLHTILWPGRQRGV